jgi:hypothetical protein
MREYDPGVMDRDGLFTTPSCLLLPNEQCVDLAGLLGRATSASYVPKTGEGFARLRSSLTRLHEQYADRSGQVRLKYVTAVYVSTRVP